MMTLKGEKIGVESIRIVSDRPSGIAVIVVDEAAENSIIVVPGANNDFEPCDLDRLKNQLRKAKILLLQLEIPVDIVVEAAMLAKKQNVITILDPAPAIALPQEIYELVDFITPNETEAADLVGFPVDNENDTVLAANKLMKNGAKNVIIKRGSKGAFAACSKERRFFPALDVKAVDTVAAGDAFNGALAYAIHSEASIFQAIEWGITAGAFAVTKEGAYHSLPTLEQLKK